ncbi:MAG: alpha/beta fold hydrolase [Chloroflexi bacterium]|nr:alpha/beta fold hydrolase [Chloroflexota bacterium]
MNVFRTPDDRFEMWPDFPFEPNYVDVTDSEDGTLRMHYVDEGPRNGHVILMLHGMPTSSFLYRRMIPPLVAAGYRCIAPDHIGFGKSDKVLDDAWYTIAKHGFACADLIQQLDLQNITFVGQDWGGPIGLRQVVEMPERFERLLIMNTWLHHDDFEYTEPIRNWNAAWHDGGSMVEAQGCGLIMQITLNRWPRGTSPLSDEEAFAAYEAPFPDRESKAGPRRFPLCLPFDNPEDSNASVQAEDFEALRSWSKPAHFIWGTADDIFTEAWGRKWAGMYDQATFDGLEAGHFLQETHGPEIVETLLRRIGEE